MAITLDLLEYSIWVEIKCLICGEIFKIYKSHLGRGRGKYYSRKCFGKAMRGKPAWNKNKKTGIVPRSAFKKGNETWNKGLKGYLAGKLNGMYGRILKPHWGKYKGINMRSGYEIAYAKYLDKNNIKWEYEPRTFDLDNTTYTPDFYLSETNRYIEIKGWMTKEALEKIKAFILKNPDIKYLLLTEKELKKEGILEWR